MVDYRDTEEFSSFKRKDKSKILKYIEFCFSRDSEFNKIQNFRTRQIKSAQKAKLNVKRQDVIAIMDFKDEDVNILINAFLGKVQNSNLYDALISNQLLFWKIQEEMRQSDDIKTMTTLSQQSKSIEDRIEGLMSSIYGTDEMMDQGAKIIRRLSYEQRINARVNVS